MTIGLKAVFTAEDRVTGAVGRMDAAIKRLGATGDSLAGLDRYTGKVFDGLKKAAVGLGALGLGAGVVAHHVVEAGADFEQSITNVGAVMGKSRGEIAELEKSALSLGVTTQFSASEVAEAMEMMARKGFDAEEILGGIPGVLNAVAASGEDMATVSTVVGSSIRGFGLEAKDASKVADLLAYAAEKTGAGITNMGTALSIAAPTARTLGVSIEDTATAVGLLQKMGLDASTAGSATATMLAKISHPSKEAAGKMAAMGIKFKDAKGDMLSFRDVLGQFIKAGDKAGGNMDRMSFFAELVGLRGDKAALALSDMAKSGDFDKLAEGIKNTGGYAEKVAKLRLDTTQSSWKLLTSTIEVLETKIFGLGSVGLKSVIDKVNAWVAANGDLISSGVEGFVTGLVADVNSLVDRIDTGVAILDNFKDGVVAAFEDSRMVKAFGVALNAIFGGDDSSGPRIKAYLLGQEIANLGLTLFALAGTVKVARAAVWAFEVGVKAVRLVTIAWNTAVAFVKGTISLFSAATEIGTANTVALGAAMTEADMAAGALAIEEAGLGVALEGVGVASVEAEAGIAAVGATAGAAAIPILAIAAAIGAVIAAAYNLKKFADENGGLAGIAGAAKGLVGIGTKDWGLTGAFQGVDAAMNAQAKARAAENGSGTSEQAAAPGAPPPPADPAEIDAWVKSYLAQRVASPGVTTPPVVTPGVVTPAAPQITPEMLKQGIEITVKADSGTTAEVTKRPTGAKVKTTPSGSL